MKVISPLIITALFAFSIFQCALADEAVAVDYDTLPREIFSGPQGKNHVQGIAVDITEGVVYYSFTTSLIKTDLNGNLIGSVTGMVGHLGCVSLDSESKRLYASLEYKNDAIGKGILKRANAGDRINETAFYVAVFDVGKIDRVGMDAEKDGVMKTIHIGEATRDYNAHVTDNGRRLKHRYGCSGIDGVTVGREIGDRESDRKYLYVAYGIYGDTTRTDNDHQVILAYDLSTLGGYERPLRQNSLHKSSPEKPDHKFFVYTGNTSWGIQNLAYDHSSGNLFAAVYKGKKQGFPNYSHFLIDGNARPLTGTLRGVDDDMKVEMLPLVEGGNVDDLSGVSGWNFDHGATGMCPIGNDYFYISHSHRDEQTGNECSTVRLYRWTGDAAEPFKAVK